MKVSLNTIKQFTEVNLSIDELVHKINGQLGGVEEVVDLSLRYKHATIVKIVSCLNHSNADRLHVCKIDDGGVTSDIERDENGYVQVVCGAPNAREGIMVVWLPPGATVPSSFADKEPFVLDSRELRGVVSHGMLASPKELAFGDSHEGILEIDPTEWKPIDTEVKPGTLFMEAYGLNDLIIDIENKMFTHRPDCFGQLGIAREIAGITHQEFTSPDWYKVFDGFNSGEGLKLHVENNALEVAPRFMAVAIKDVAVKPSPLWLQAELVRLGAKPINNIVDVTNYVMLLTAQPTHAYDYDKLRGQYLGVRLAKKGESITLLNHKTYQLDESDIVIVDGEGPVGLAGIMGGGESEVSDETKNIVLEVATFDMYAVRKSSMRHGVFTDALTRFNKGQSPIQNPYVMQLLMKSIFDVSSGEQASDVFDKKEFTDEYDDSLGQKWQPDTIPVEFINNRLGLELSDIQITKLLHNVEFHSHDLGGQDEVCFTAPFWRTDIEIPEDIVEEVGRLYGFEEIPRELPRRTMRPTVLSPKRRAVRKIRETMKAAGANEVLTYSFVHGNVLTRAGQNPDEAFRLSNALSPDLQYLRLSVLPSLLDKVNANIRAGHDEFVLYEIGKGHNKTLHADDDDGLPAELEFLDMVYASKAAREGAPFYQIRVYVEELARAFGREIVTKPIEDELNYAVTAPFETGRSAYIHDGLTDEFIGLVGELKADVAKKFKLPAYSAAATLDLAVFEKFETEKQANYKALSKYPSVTQDISLKVEDKIGYSEVESELLEFFDSELNQKYVWQLHPLVIYKDETQADKTISFRVTIASYSETLNDAYVTELLDKLSKELSQKIDAKRV